MIYISSNKCSRQLYQLPYRTHNNLLHLIFKDQPIDVQLHLRIMKYIMSNLKVLTHLYGHHKIVYVRKQITHV